ncbi:hypothetical protein OC861_004969 [Tilletia horrida]|nr:hypothetical protein OC861_004969 [Tilletia horrida]
MASTRDCSIIFNVSTPEATRKLTDEGLKLGVARSIAANGKFPSANVVWRSAAPEPNWVAKWTEGKYALSWTPELGQVGAQIKLVGSWQPAQIGSRYDVDADGKWQASGSGYDRNSITVRNLSTAPIHIVIGAQSVLTGEFEPIWVDPHATNDSNKSTFLPDQRLLLWYGKDVQQASVFDPSSCECMPGQLNPSSARTPWSQASGSKWQADFDLDEGYWKIQPI